MYNVLGCLWAWQNSMRMHKILIIHKTIWSTEGSFCILLVPGTISHFVEVTALYLKIQHNAVIVNTVSKL